jgi:hypothetical protein
MRWRSKRAMRWRHALWLAAGLGMVLLNWTHRPEFVPALAIWGILTLFLVIEICPHCGIPLMWKPRTRIWDRVTTCSNCGRQIV